MGGEFCDSPTPTRYAVKDTLLSSVFGVGTYDQESREKASCVAFDMFEFFVLPPEAKRCWAGSDFTLEVENNENLVRFSPPRHPNL